MNSGLFQTIASFLVAAVSGKYSKVLCLLLFSLTVQAKVQITEMETDRIKNSFVVKLHTDRIIDIRSLEVDFIRETIQINVPLAQIKGNKNLMRVSDRIVRSVYSYKPSRKLFRTRIILKKGMPAASFLNAVEITRSGKTLSIHVTGKGDRNIAKGTGNEVSMVLPVARRVTKKMKNSGVANKKPPGRVKNEVTQGSLRKRAKGKNVSKAQASAEGSRDNQKKQGTDDNRLQPIKGESRQQEAESLTNFFIVLGFLAVVILFSFFKVRKLSIRNRSLSLNGTKIRILAQRFLDQKKSIAIIQVSGENLLVGITEQNISVLKTLSLLNEETSKEVSKTPSIWSLKNQPLSEEKAS